MTVNRLEALEKTKQDVHNILEKMGDRAPPQMRKMAEEVIPRMVVDQLIPKDALGFTPHMMEEVYQYGYKLFQAGKYKEALDVFTFLRNLDITDVRYSFAIAACHQYNKNYQEAAGNYIITSYLDPYNPLPNFHLYDCFMKSDQKLSAFRALHDAKVLADMDPQYSILSKKIELELEHLLKVIRPLLEEIDAEALKREQSSNAKKG